jgi:DNA polymerase elongation subunit (family B)
MVLAYSAFPYNTVPTVFYEYRLAKPYAVRTLAEYFVKNSELDDAYSEGGVLRVVPHSAEDFLTQFMVATGISGFGWVQLASAVADPHDAKRSEIEACPCTYVGDCRCDALRSMSDEHGDIAPLRVLGIDIECVKDEGLPNPRTNAVIIIGVIACRAVNGLVQPESMQNVIFTWYMPGSGGVAATPNVHHMVAVSSELEMFMAFGAFLTSYDPDIYVGHNVVGFDIPYLVTRASILGVNEVMFMGRKRQAKWAAPREITRVRKNGDTRKSLRADTPGRIQLDTLSFIQGLKKESSYSLGALSRKYLHDSKGILFNSV